MWLPDSFSPRWSRPAGDSQGDLWFVFRGQELLVLEGASGAPEIPSSSVPPVPVGERHCIGLLGSTPCWAARASGETSPAGASWEGLRGLFDRLDDGLLGIAGRAGQVLEFERTHQYCGVCAALTEVDDGGRARRCPRCAAVFYPRLAPAMMVLVTRPGPRGRELLLARGLRFPTPVYSALAGFVEPSETLEESVHREVREEVGITVSGLRYFASQCWPFPQSLMVAFLAEYAGGEIACDPSEILDARWFPVDRLPLLPHRLSVARRLIEHAAGEARSASPTG